MPRVKLNIKFGKNEGLLISPSNLSDLFLTGIPLCYPNGTKISESNIKQKIANSQRIIENILSIKFNYQRILEENDFIMSEFKSWGYLRAIYPVREVNKLEGRVNNVTQINYPKGWLSLKDVSDTSTFRNIYIVPNASDGTAQQYQVAFSGMFPHLGYLGNGFIPNYWKLDYCTGWSPDEMPEEFFDLIGKIASLQVLAITGDLIFGAGIGNQNISIDGISQSYSTTKGAGKGAFSGRIEQYKKEIEETIPMLRNEYVGILFRAL